MHSNNAVIEVRNVTKTFKDLYAVNGLDLTIYQGEYVALLGPNGAGKTTLVEMIEGIQTPDSGQIEILGKNWKQHEMELRQRLGISLQETRFNDRLTTEETLAMFASFYHLGRNRVQEVLEQMGLVEKRETYVMNLSGGQRQRLALGISILNKPQILLLDEPTTGLDPKARRDIWKVLQTLKTEGTTMILTTHYMEEAETLCERILIMNKGKILAEGTLEALLNSHGGGEIIEFSLEDTQDPKVLSKVDGALAFQWDEVLGKGQLRVPSILEALPQFFQSLETHKFRLKEFQCRKMTLDDLFISMTGRHLDE